MDGGETFRKLRIAMVGARGVPASYSGIERAVEELGGRLAGIGHEVTVFCMAGRYAARQDSYKGMRLRFFPSTSGKHAEMLVHAALSSVAASLGRFDVVHFHACGPSLFAWVPRLTGKVTVATLHGQDWRAPKWNRLASRVLLAGEWSACRLASGSVCVSRDSQRDLRARRGAEANFIANGVAPVAARPLRLAAQAYGLVAGEYVLFVGRLTRGKNAHHLMEAFRELPTHKRLVIVGGDGADPPYGQLLRTLAAQDPRVLLTGALYGEMLEEICSNAYLFCLPSEHEGMSVALLEALSYGVPALVSDIGANLEVIEEESGPAGLVFKMGSVESLRTQLAEALAAPERLARLRACGQRIVAERYSWDRAARETEALYLRLLDRGQRSPANIAGGVMPASARPAAGQG